MRYVRTVEIILVFHTQKKTFINNTQYDINDYNNATEVRVCELVKLDDLDQSIIKLYMDIIQDVLIENLLYFVVLVSPDINFGTFNLNISNNLSLKFR